MPGPLDGLLSAIKPRQLTPEEQALQDAQAQQVQAADPAWKRMARSVFEGGSDALMGLVGVGPDTTMNRVGELAGAAAPFAGMKRHMGNIPKWTPTPDLPMDEASRMARAAEQGYTVPVYHGTHAKENFNEFRPAIAPGRGDFGIHVTPNPDTAWVASGDRPGSWPYQTEKWKDLAATENATRPVPGARIMPLQARMQKTLELPDIGLWDSQRHWQEALTDRRSANMVGIGPYKSTIPTNDPEAAQALHELATNFRPKSIKNGLEFQQALLDKLQSQGYDSISYKNYAEGSGEPSYLLLDPGQLKSKFARFDPAAFGKTRDIMAGLAGAGVASTLFPKEKK